MPIPSIPDLDINGGDTITDVETILNSTKDCLPNDGEAMYRGLKLLTVGGFDFVVNMPAHTIGIVYGLGITRNSVANYTLEIGQWQVMGQVFGPPSPPIPYTVALDPPDATLDRYDLIVGDNTGAVTFVTGTPGGPPTLIPSPAPNQAILYVVAVPSLASGFPDTVIFSTRTDTLNPYKLESDTKGRVVIPAARSGTATYTATGLVDETVTRHLVDTTAAPVVLTLHDPTAIPDEGIEHTFYDSGNAAVNSFTLQYIDSLMTPVTIATATTNGQVIRLTQIGTNYYIG